MSILRIQTCAKATSKRRINKPHKTQSQSKFAHWSQLELVPFEERLLKGETIDDFALAKGLRRFGARALPEPILEYICRHLEYKGSGQRGRPGLPEAEKRKLAIILRHHYRKRLEWINRRLAKKHPAFGLNMLKDHNYFKRAPSEIAAMMVAKKFWGNSDSYKTVLNRITSQKSTPI